VEFVAEKYNEREKGKICEAVRAEKNNE